jgi:hypothetical protein
MAAIQRAMERVERRMSLLGARMLEVAEEDSGTHRIADY